MEKQQLIDDIGRLKRERNAVILGHNYQRAEVQNIADFLGDSLDLARRAASLDCDVVVFCGVHFMAESAAMLDPKKIVLLPRLDAGCPMADMVTAEALRARKAELGGIPAVCYINTSAAVKAECEICCTSANAVKVVESMAAERLLFVPDRNLGQYIQRFTKKEIVLWDGYCNTHDRLTAHDILRSRTAHAGAPVLVHPECRPEVIDAADAVKSTNGMIGWSRDTAASDIIVGTEEGMLHRLRREVPAKRFHLAHSKLICPTMKLTSLESVHFALEHLSPRITVPDFVRDKALGALERMLAVPRD